MKPALQQREHLYTLHSFIIFNQFLCFFLLIYLVLYTLHERVCSLTMFEDKVPLPKNWFGTPMWPPFSFFWNTNMAAVTSYENAVACFATDVKRGKKIQNARKPVTDWLLILYSIDPVAQNLSFCA